MSCRRCEIAQGDSNDIGGEPMVEFFTYVRVGNGNILISGCEEHMKETIEQLRAGSAKIEENKEAE